jgi:hypothetical protein
VKWVMSTTQAVLDVGLSMGVCLSVQLMSRHRHESPATSTRKHRYPCTVPLAADVTRHGWDGGMDRRIRENA